MIRLGKFWQPMVDLKHQQQAPTAPSHRLEMTGLSPRRRQAPRPRRWPCQTAIVMHRRNAPPPARRILDASANPSAAIEAHMTAAACR
jgi:hypothetical protein